MFLLPKDELYDLWHIKRPFPILNECIQKRYRDKGYQVVFALYPDKNIFGIIPKKEDKIILTDVTFEEASTCYSDGTLKKDFIPRYPNEQMLLKQLGNIQELVVGGYHFHDCVKRVAEAALQMGINSLVDLDLTDLFFNLYKYEDYFKINNYEAQKYKEFWQHELEKQGEKKEFIERQWQIMYGSPVYGFSLEERSELKK